MSRHILRFAAPLLLAVPATAQVYQTTFDNAVGWTLDSDAVVPDYCWCVDADSAAAPGGAFRSAPSSLNFNDGIDVGAGWGWAPSGNAESPVIDLALIPNPVLTYWCNWDCEIGCAGIDERTLSIIPAGGGPAFYSECVASNCAASGTWHEHEVALAPGWGQVQIQFNYDAVDVFVNGGTGWFIDDLAVAPECEDIQGFCPLSPNSADSSGANIRWLGSNSVSANDLELLALNGPPNRPGLFFYGTNQVLLPFGDGVRCVGGTIFRFAPTTSDNTGVATQIVDNTLAPAAGTLTLGTRWFFQYWFRDPGGPGGTGFNVTNALNVLFCP